MIRSRSNGSSCICVPNERSRYNRGRKRSVVCMCIVYHLFSIIIYIRRRRIMHIFWYIPPVIQPYRLRRVRIQSRLRWRSLANYIIPPPSIPTQAYSIQLRSLTDCILPHCAHDMAITFLPPGCAHACIYSCFDSLSNIIAQRQRRRRLRQKHVDNACIILSIYIHNYTAGCIQNNKTYLKI